MYYYIVDPRAGGGTINAIQDKLKSTLHNLKIDGQFSKVIDANDAHKLTRDALKRGAKTIVAVGGDELVNQVLASAHGQRASGIAIGIVPLGKDNVLARHLGIEGWRQACDVLSSRRLREFKLMTVNTHVFLHSCDITPAPKKDEVPSEFAFLAELDGSFRLRTSAASIEITNQKLLNPHLDNELVIRLVPNGRSRKDSAIRSELDPDYTQLHGAALKIECETPVQATIDGHAITGKKFVIALDDWRARLISHRPEREREV